MEFSIKKIIDAFISKRTLINMSLDEVNKYYSTFKETAKCLFGRRGQQVSIHSWKSPESEAGRCRRMDMK